jgi:hypothetical protein
MGRYDALTQIEQKPHAKDASATDVTPVSQPPPPLPIKEESREIASRQPSHIGSVRPNAPSPVRPNGKRIITRNSFEIYEDQMDALRRHSFQEKMDGRLGSMSNMVREAIDEYLNKKSTEK